jgi:hypothetical protein
MKEEIIKKINTDVQKVTPLLPDNLKEWLHYNKTQPFLMKYDNCNLWVITKEGDSSYQIVYDQDKEKYGLISILPDHQIIYLGLTGGLLETIENM